jgi:hypothetical protein
MLCSLAIAFVLVIGKENQKWLTLTTYEKGKVLNRWKMLKNSRNLLNTSLSIDYAAKIKLGEILPANLWPWMKGE